MYVKIVIEKLYVVKAIIASAYILSNSSVLLIRKRNMHIKMYSLFTDQYFVVDSLVYYKLIYRSQINFDVRGLYGPRAQLVENLPKHE